MSAAQPFMKFYPQDWRADEKLRLCSLAARGLWMEMLALMHRSERYGQLLISGHVPTDAQLAVQVGAPPNEVSALLAELESAGVFSRSASGAIYSRRMTRDAKKAKIARMNGKSGGNPSLRKSKENCASDNQPDNPPLNLGDKPHARVSRSQSSDTNVSGVPPPEIDWQKRAFDLGVEVLGSAGIPPPQARSLVGKWRKVVGDERVGDLLDQARDKADPVQWMAAAVNRQDSAQDELYRAIELKYGTPPPRGTH